MEKIRMPYKFSLLCIFFGIILAYISFYYGNQMSVALYFEEVDGNASNIFNSEYAVSCQYQGSMEVLISEMQTIPTGLTMGGVALYVDKYDAECISNVIVTQTSEVPYQFVDGSMPQNLDQPCVLLGKEHKKCTYEKNGCEYIKICGEDYLVSGYIKAEHSVIYDYAIILFWECLTENVKAQIEYLSGTEGISMILQSNEEDTKIVFQDFCEEEPELAQHVFPSSQYDSWFSTAVTSTNYRAYAYLTYLLSIFILAMVVKYWLLQRKREFAIRRMDGFSTAQLIGLVAKDILKIILLATIVIWFIQQILNYVNDVDTLAIDMIVQMISILTFVIITFCLLMIQPLCYVTKQNLSLAIREGRHIG